MKKPNIPTRPGVRFGGGYYAGRFYIGATAHALIVSPRTKGETEAKAWNESLSNVAGALSYADGLGNTRAMAKAGSELAKHIIALKIGEFDDWHIPSRLESLVLFGELGGHKLFAADGKEAFAREWHWTSTQHAGYADYAWCQLFGHGNQSNLHKSNELRARAVRAIKI